MPTVRIIADNCINFFSQKQKAYGFVTLYQDVGNLMLEKHEGEISSRLRSEVVDTEVCQGFATDEFKAALRNINPTKAAGPEKNPSKLPAPSGPGLCLPAGEYHQQIVGGDQSPSKMESSRHQTNTKRREGPT